MRGSESVTHSEYNGVTNPSKDRAYHAIVVRFLRILFLARHELNVGDILAFVRQVPKLSNDTVDLSNLDSMKTQERVVHYSRRKG